MVERVDFYPSKINSHIFDLVHLGYIDLFEKNLSVELLTTFLIEAAAYGQLELVRLLLDRGAEITSEGDNALYSACLNNHPDILELLLDRVPNIHDDITHFIFSFEWGYLEIVRLLLDREVVDLHAENERALRSACKNGQLEVVRLLLDRGANIHIDYPLRIASRNGDWKMVRLLLDRGANIHMDEEYPLRIAKNRGHSELVQLLLDRGADIDVANQYNLRRASRMEENRRLVNQGVTLQGYSA